MSLIPTDDEITAFRISSLEMERDLYRSKMEALVAENAKLKCAAEAADRLVQALPKCDQCESPATRAYRRGAARFCDNHGAVVPPYPRAQPLRDTIAALAELRKETA